VSHIVSFTFFPSTSIDFTLKSTPMVAGWSVAKESSVKRSRMLDFPTPLFVRICVCERARVRVCTRSWKVPAMCDCLPACLPACLPVASRAVRAQGRTVTATATCTLQVLKPEAEEAQHQMPTPVTVGSGSGCYLSNTTTDRRHPDAANSGPTPRFGNRQVASDRKHHQHRCRSIAHSDCLIHMDFRLPLSSSSPCSPSRPCRAPHEQS
jgi:hypothetical protein